MLNVKRKKEPMMGIEPTNLLVTSKVLYHLATLAVGFDSPNPYMDHSSILTVHTLHTTRIPFILFPRSLSDTPDTSPTATLYTVVERRYTPY